MLRINIFSRGKATVKKKVQDESVMLLPLMKRNEIITPAMVNASFRVHTGREYLKVSVKEEFLGHRFGEFVPTKTTNPCSKPKLGKKEGYKLKNSTSGSYVPAVSYKKIHLIRGKPSN